MRVVIILRCTLETHNKNLLNLPMSVCSKFCWLCFCQKLFRLVYSRESYLKHIKRERFFEAQCMFVKVTSFSKEDKVSIRALYDQKECDAGQFMTKFLDKSWTKNVHGVANHRIVDC